MIDVATTPVERTLTPPVQAFERRFRSAATDSVSFIQELDELLTLENVNGYTFQASPYAYERAKLYLEAVTAWMGGRFQRPEFVPDGEGGIDIEWVVGQKHLTLSCRASNAQRDYVYWEENGEYEAVDATFGRLFARLTLLNA